MENFTVKTLNDAEQVLIAATKNGITLSESCTKLNKKPEFMTGILSKIENAFQEGVIKQGKRDALINLYSQYTKSQITNSRKSKSSVSKAFSATSSRPTRQTFMKGTKKSKKSSKNSGDTIFLEDEEIDTDISLTKQEKEMLEYDAETDDNYEERSVGESLRGKDSFVDKHGNKLHRITGYKYKIYIKGEKPLTGEFCREEMDKIYRLYSSMDGAGLTLRAVSREFNFLNFRDFKRILRAFNITKSSLPIAPHILEEATEDESIAMVRRNKENSILKKLDSERYKYYEKKFFDTQKEIVDIKSNSEWVEQIINSYFTKRKPNFTFPVSRLQSKLTKSSKPDNSKTDKPLFAIFGDIHYGKKFANAMFGRGYNKDIAHERIMQIAKHTIEESKVLKTKEIIFICLGDLIECALEDGMHPGHSTEMDLLQEEQIFFAIDSMLEMLKEVLKNTDCKITFCSIHGNHDRLGIHRDDDKSRTAGKIVTGMIKKLTAEEKRIEVVMPKNNLLKLIRGKICVFAQHGDSSLNKKKPSELVNLWGEGTSCYHLLLKGHWHSLKADEGTNYLTLTAPSVASTDKYIMEELGNNNLPGFILGHEPNCYGFDYKKITLY